MKKVAFIGLISASLSLSTPLIAAEEKIQCNPDGNQVELNTCAENDYKVADKELNSTWKQLIKKKKENKLYVEKMKVSQNLWIKFRDAEVEAKFACEDSNMRSCWGSMYPLLRLSVLTSLTKERTKQLQTYMETDQGIEGAL